MPPCLPLFFSFSRPTCVLSAFPSFACCGAIFGEAAPPRALPKTVDNCKTSIEQVETKIVGAILIISLLPMSSTYPGYRQVMSLSITIVVAGCGRHRHPWRWLPFATRTPALPSLSLGITFPPFHDGTQSSHASYSSAIVSNGYLDIIPDI